MQSIRIHPQVREAMDEGRAVVVLESAVVTRGMPRQPAATLRIDSPGWRRERAVNLEVAMLMHRAVVDGGAVPAMVAVLDGALCIGLEESEVERLALDEQAGKASIANLAVVCAQGRSAGTTVSATLHAMLITNRQRAAGTRSGTAAALRVFATGGIGGVHRQPTTAGQKPAAPLDVSADLLQLARTPALVVCAGAKSILDVPATLEALETLGVPVLGFRTNRFPQFYSAGSDDLVVTSRVESVEEAVATARACWNALGQSTGIILANPIPGEFAMSAAEVDELVERAEAGASLRTGSAGADRTPYLLSELARLTEGRSLRANIALLESNARLAAEVAGQLSH